MAILEDDDLVEFMVDRPETERIVGDIYLGQVEAVLPGIQAAFVDIGTEKAAFLHVSDVVRDADARTKTRTRTARTARTRRYPPIQELVKKGERLLVQVSKEPIGTKGPRVTTQISLPGRFLVFMPYSDHIGVSRKIDDREERSRLRALAREVVPENSGGVIIRTVGEELTREIFEREFKTLHGTWKKIQRRARGAKPPSLIHREAKLTRGIIRDVFTEKVDALDHRRQGSLQRGQAVPRRCRPRTDEPRPPLHRPDPALRQVRRRGRDPRGLPAQGQPPLAAATSSSSRPRRSSRSTSTPGATRGRKTPSRRSCARTWTPPGRSPVNSGSAMWAASSYATSSTWSRRRTRNACSRSCALI